VIEQTIRRKLPEDFQTAEFCLQKGLLDMVVPRTEMRSALSRLLAFVGAPRLVPMQIEPAPAAQP